MWDAKQENFQPAEKCFFLTSPFIELTGQLSQLTANMNTDGFGPPSGPRNVRMKREKFVTLVEEALAALPTRFRKRIHNVAVLVQNLPPAQLPPQRPQKTRTINSPTP